MAKPIKTLKQKMSREALARAEEQTKEMLANLPLHELRAARRMTQQNLSQILGINQGAVSKLERRADMYVSTLRNFVTAMGGELEITARFPDGLVRINQFEEIKADAGNAKDGGA